MIDQLGCTRYVPYVQTPYRPLSGLHFDQNSPNQGLGGAGAPATFGKVMRFAVVHVGTSRIIPHFDFQMLAGEDHVSSIFIMFPNLKSDHLSQAPICSHLTWDILDPDPWFFGGLGGSRSLSPAKAPDLSSPC